MSTKPLALPNSALYEQDYAAWATETGRLIREGRFTELDLENLAEEIEAMAGRDRREVLSRLTAVIHHLLKWKYQPEQRSASWRTTVVTQRGEITLLLEQSPSLRPTVPRSLAQVYGHAVTRAIAETGLPADAFPARCPFSVAQILDLEFFPD